MLLAAAPPETSIAGPMRLVELADCSTSIRFIEPLTRPSASRNASSQCASTSTIAFPMPSTSSSCASRHPLSPRSMDRAILVTAPMSIVTGLPRVNSPPDYSTGCAERLRPPSRRSAPASTAVPWAISAGEVYSSGRWLTPPGDGTKIIAAGQMRAMKTQSWYARLTIRSRGSAGLGAGLLDRRRAPPGRRSPGRRRSGSPRACATPCARGRRAGRGAHAARAPRRGGPGRCRGCRCPSAPWRGMLLTAPGSTRQQPDRADGVGRAAAARLAVDRQHDLRRGDQRVVAVAASAPRRRGRPPPTARPAGSPAPRWPSPRRSARRRAPARGPCSMCSSTKAA